MTPWVIGTQNALQGLIISNLKDSRILHGKKSMGAVAILRLTTRRIL